jgi:hypothetical protein
MKVFTTIIACLLFINLFAQEDLPPDYSNYNNLLYGIVYEPVNYNSIGHPFILGNKIYTANLHFDGNTYKNVSLKYDLYKQKIVLYQDYNSSRYRFIELNINLVDSFEIIDEKNKVHYFQKNNTDNDLMPEIKFLEFAYKNEITYKVGRNKYFKELAEDYKGQFYIKEYHYLIVNGKWEFINSKDDILDLFADHKKELKKFIRKNKIKMRLIKAPDLLKVIIYYEDLTN